MSDEYTTKRGALAAVSDALWSRQPILFAVALAMCAGPLGWGLYRASLSAAKFLH